MQDLPAETTRDLFTPIEVGPLTLPNRIVMAPLTRSRAGPGNVPTVLSALYYAQRASAGLIISEATQVAPEGQGYISTPGIHSAEQVAGWKCVTSAVHACGGRMVLQLWHVGRISHPSFQPGGALPVAPSAIRPNAKAFTANGFEEIPTPRALETSEIPGIVAQHAQGARNALAAGFDGVEVHGANGYLIDQFLRDGTNKRTDAYGGSIENRMRFLLEVGDAGGAAVPPFDYLAIKRRFGGLFMANNGFDKVRANESIAQGRADLVAFGKPFISNPDLVTRLYLDVPLS